jgi:hypothetical protein
MNSNFDWQKHQTNERVQARYQEAEIHRSLKSAGGTSPSIIGKIIMLPFVGLGGLVRWVGGYGRSAETHSNDQAEISRTP